MEGVDKVENSQSDKGSPPLHIDPRCFQDALRTFFQPIKTDDPRLDFYTVYKREATEYDTDYIKKYDEDLNTTLIFAGLFSAVSSAFVIDVNSNLQPDPNEQSAALLRAILLTLNRSAIPGEAPIVPPVQEDPQREIVIATCLMYASLLISLLAAFVAMLGKQWLNRYLRNSGGSMIERCGDRQRKCDGLEKWPLHFFVESLPVMLQVALFLLACGLCRHMWSINTSVAYVLIILTGLGFAFYVAIVIVGTSSYACPFQTPVSTALRSPWKKVRQGIASSIFHFKWVIAWTHQAWEQRVWPSLRRQSLPMTIPLEDVQVEQSEPWLKPMDLYIIHQTNASDAQCVSWVLRNITDPEALDAAIRLAGTVRWFDDGVNADLPYDVIVSTFEACFDSTGNLYPGSRDRAYYSGRAIMWIHALAMCESEEFASAFPFPITEYSAPGLDVNLRHLLQINVALHASFHLADLLNIDQQYTSSHSQWVSNVLLHLSWAKQTPLHFEFIPREITIPLNATLNRLLSWCIFLGSPVEEEALKVRDKSDRVERILYQLSKAIVSAIGGTYNQHKLIPLVLRDLIKLETRPACLSKMAYEWCSVIYENHRSLEGWENLLFACLEIGFRHFDLQGLFISTTLAHTEHHRELVDVVFKSQESEAIADLLLAFTTRDYSLELAHASLSICTGHLVSLHNLVPFSSRLRQLVIRSVEVIGYKGFEGAGVERFIDLLNHLHVTVKDIDSGSVWAVLLLDTLRGPEGVRNLSHWYWDLLVELVILESPWLESGFTYDPRIMTILVEAQEWSKLECWMGTLWILSPPGVSGATEEEFNHSMLSLLRQRPGAAKELEQWMERWGQINHKDIPESFRRICEQAREAAQRDAPPVASPGGSTKDLAHASSSGGSKFWESLPYHVL